MTIYLSVVGLGLINFWKLVDKKKKLYEVSPTQCFSSTLKYYSLDVQRVSNIESTADLHEGLFHRVRYSNGDVK